MKSFMIEHGEEFVNALNRAAQIATGAVGNADVKVEGAVASLADGERKVRIVVSPWGAEEGEEFSCEWVGVARWREALVRNA